MSKPSGLYPQVSKGKGGCSPCWQHPPVTDGAGECPVPPTSSPTPCPVAAASARAGLCEACESLTLPCSTRGCGSSVPTDSTFSICTAQAPAGCASHKGALITSQTQPLTRLSSQSASFADTVFSSSSSSHQLLAAGSFLPARRAQAAPAFPSHAGTHSPRCCPRTFPSLPAALRAPAKQGSLAKGQIQDPAQCGMQPGEGKMKSASGDGNGLFFLSDSSWPVGQ